MFSEKKNMKKSSCPDIRIKYILFAKIAKSNFSKIR